MNVSGPHNGLPLPHPIRVLVVDDMPDNADSLAWVLRLEGFDATTAIYAATALTAASTSVFDAILLDIAMPGMDGYQLAKDLRGLYPVKPLLIAITGYGGDEYRKRSRDEGFDYHIVKPADPFELAALIREHTLAASP